MNIKPDRKILLALVTTKMTFGKYKGRLVCDIPTHYLVWMIQNDAMPKGTLGQLLHTVLEIKTNNLEDILYELKRWKRN
ncbi:MAG: DUF3820 family protein [Saprospiraceae bacterium]